MTKTEKTEKEQEEKRDWLAPVEEIEDGLGALGGPEAFGQWQYLSVQQKNIADDKNEKIVVPAGTFVKARKVDGKTDKKNPERIIRTLNCMILCTRFARAHFNSAGTIDCRSVDGDVPSVDNPYSTSCNTCLEAAKPYEENGCPLKVELLVLDLEDEMNPYIVSFTKSGFGPVGAFKKLLGRVAVETKRRHFHFVVPITLKRVTNKMGGDDYYIPEFPSEEFLRDQLTKTLKPEYGDAATEQFAALRPLFDPTIMPRGVARRIEPSTDVTTVTIKGDGAAQVTDAQYEASPEVSEEFDPFAEE